MLGALTILLVFQLVGEIISHGLGLPIPGPVIGFILLLLALLVGAWAMSETGSMVPMALAASACLMLTAPLVRHFLRPVAERR